MLQFQDLAALAVVNQQMEPLSRPNGTCIRRWAIGIKVENWLGKVSSHSASHIQRDSWPFNRRSVNAVLHYDKMRSRKSCVTRTQISPQFHSQSERTTNIIYFTSFSTWYRTLISPSHVCHLRFLSLHLMQNDVRDDGETSAERHQTAAA